MEGYIQKNIDIIRTAPSGRAVRIGLIKREKAKQLTHGPRCAHCINYLDLYYVVSGGLGVPRRCGAPLNPHGPSARLASGPRRRPIPLAAIPRSTYEELIARRPGARIFTNIF